MQSLRELDSLTVRVLVDNECDAMSSGGCRSDGFEYTPAASTKIRAGHGLSILVTGNIDDQCHTVLFDAGGDPELWKANAEALNIDLESIEAAVLSHYHWDHSGGLAGALELASQARAASHRSPVLIDLHKTKIIQRGKELPDGSVKVHQPDNPQSSKLAKLGSLELHDEEHTICDNFFYVSGHIPRRTAYEKGIPGSLTMVGGRWIKDEEIAEERYLACKVKDRGLVVLSACSHAGISNVCHDAKRRSGDATNVFGVIGGFHLAGKKVEDRIDCTVDDLKAIDPAVLLAGHCTGWRAKAQLAVTFKDRFQPLSVGSTYAFRSQPTR